MNGLFRARARWVTQKADVLKSRTKQFAFDVIRFVRTLPDTDEAKTVGRQLLRCGTGVASNYRSACRTRSRAEFVARIGVALEESDESALWFEILTESAISCTAESFRLLQESDELCAIFAASSITAKIALTRTEGR
jgi:four helix bundle protein